MKIKMWVGMILVFAFGSGGGGAAWAAPLVGELRMVAVASSYPNGYTGQIVAKMDERVNGVASFVFSDTRGVSQEFTTEQLQQGVVLLHEMGKDILKIQGPDFKRDAGGMLKLVFLRNFLGSDRRELHFDYVRRGGVLDWVLQTDDSEGREVFDGIKIIVTKTLGLPTGVGDIVLSSQERTVRRYNPYDLPAGTLMLDGVDPALAGLKYSIDE